MPRLLATVVAVAILSVSGLASMLHVHAYEGHDHPGHHHGPAAHAHGNTDHNQEHQDLAPAGPDAVRLESCDPGDHTVVVTFTCVSPTTHIVFVLNASVPAVLATVHPSYRLAPTDVRAHSPPRLTDAPLRAPPVAHPA